MQHRACGEKQQALEEGVVETVVERRCQSEGGQGPHAEAAEQQRQPEA